MLWMNWISCLFFVQGMHVGVLGADHTWFMTTLMICYILTPLIEKIWKRIQYKKTQWGILVGLFIVPFIMADRIKVSGTLRISENKLINKKNTA